MKIRKYILVSLLLVYPLGAFASNIDLDGEGLRYAWGENVGWINFKPSSGHGAYVTDSFVAGFAWGENIGWINLFPSNGGVVNDGQGNLSGYAWGENVGWINFAPTGAGVTINPSTGVFSGHAWGENSVWINFAPTGGGIQTSWSLQPQQEQEHDGGDGANVISGCFIDTAASSMGW